MSRKSLLSTRARKWSKLPNHRQSRRRIRLQELEDRTTPTVLSTFELDTNVTTGTLGTIGSTTTSHDWDEVFAGTSGALATAFVTDPINTNADDIFTGGGTKDTNGIQQGPWLYTASKPQPKNDIMHAYAAAYTDPSNGHLILYAGLDRYDNSGDSTAGFWFFANSLEQNPNVTTGGGHPFIGTHTDGDLLLVSDFTTGGSTSTIKLFRWTGDDATGSLVEVPTLPGTTFASVNGAPTDVPWSYLNKSGGTEPAAGEFLEGGVDLTALGLHGCFSFFLAETRSSQSPTATLSDFVVGSFPLCSVEATPFSGLSKVGDSVVYELSVTNTGAGAMYLQNVSDTVLGDIVVDGVVQDASGPITSIDSSALAGNNPLEPGQTVTIYVTRTVQATDADPTVSTVTFTYNDEEDFSGEQISDSAENTVNLFQPSATMTVVAGPTTAVHLGDLITYTYKVSNTSSSDSPNLVLGTAADSFTDTLLGDLEADAIAAGGGNVAPGDSFNFTETRAVQAGDPSPLVNLAGVVFTLAQNLGAFPNLIGVQASSSVTLLPNLIIEKSITDGIDAIHPGDTASFTITVTNDGAGAATNVVVNDQLPEKELLTWVVNFATFDTATLDSTDFLTATSGNLPAGATATVTVSAVVPLDIFGSEPSGGTGNLPDGPFELDGNAVVDSVDGDDWANAAFGDGGGSIASSFVTDLVNSRDDDIFTGGGSKDTLGIQQGRWLFTEGKPQAKNDITHAYAAMYVDPNNGHTILYAGLDRYDNSGDATAGFWFFTNPIGEDPSVTTNGGHPFVGEHSDGDILLVSDFTQGGSVSTIQVYRWTGDDATGSLVAVDTPAGTTFATVNSGAIEVPWTFRDKSRNEGPAAGEFLEGGVDLTALGLGGCFSNFLAETRSSQSPTATLSDFVIGSFNTCSIELPNTATVSADGIAEITSNQVVITISDEHHEARGAGDSTESSSSPHSGSFLTGSNLSGEYWIDSNGSNKKK